MATQIGLHNIVVSLKSKIQAGDIKQKVCILQKHIKRDIPKKGMRKKSINKQINEDCYMGQ